jgi:methionyl-tRNA formyltransferase
MRILLLANNWVGWQVATLLKEQGEDVVGLVLHPLQKRKYGAEIIETVGIPAGQIFDGSHLRQPDVMDAIKNLKADIGLSIFFGYILTSDFLRIFPAGVVNLHPSYLPFNKGASPNIWSIVEGTPAGVTLHYIDEGVDTGNIIAQNLVPVAATDTGETLYRKLELACIDLFQKTWNLVADGKAQGFRQVSKTGTFHRVRDVETIDEIQLERTYTGRELLNILRARTFPPYPGAYFWEADRKVFLQLRLYYEDER